jgi:hypothetical protein
VRVVDLDWVIFSVIEDACIGSAGALGIITANSCGG